MAQKRQKNILKEKIELSVEVPTRVGYVDCLLGTPVKFQIKSNFSEAVTLRIGAESEEGIIVPYEATAEVPFESTVSLSAAQFSPLVLAENDEVRTCSIETVVSFEDAELVRRRTEIVVLPFDWWEGLDGNPERVALFVRPRLAEVAGVLADAGKRLKKWKSDAEFYGYTGADKNAVRQIAAAIFAAIKACSFEKSEETDLSVPLPAAKEGLMKERASSTFRLAVFACACLEAARLHPVLALGKNSVGVGVWLYDSCFLDSVTDDCEIVEKYASDGINNLAFFDADDLFAGRSVAFTPSEHHFRQKLKEGYFESFVDIRRCRIGQIPPCPLRGKGLHGYELLREEEMSSEEAPRPLPVFRKLNLDGKQPKNRQWERRLLDLTTRNALLNFTGKHALHIAAGGCDELYARLSGSDGMKLRASQESVPSFGEALSPQQRELILLEQGKGFLRAYTDAKTLSETATRLVRKNREADEESGAKILYAAFGFLRYCAKEDGAFRYAPLVLAPVGFKRAKGNEEFLIALEEGEYFVNSTLLEFLKQEFNIDVRGLGGDVSALKIAEILAMMRAETAGMKGWDVLPDCYLAAFSFQRYLMWNDLKRHFGELKKNELVAALLENKPLKQEFEPPEGEDDYDPSAVMLPLPSDSSQFSAVALSGKGASFVLHGPPGTGKSQTITNVIANALYAGKRVLFVAEKKAALDVVKKRLDGIGIGEFCLELHSNKTDKGDVVKRLEDTLALKNGEGAEELTARAEEIAALRDELKAPMRALHKKRRLGVSVYQAIVSYLQNKNAPDILDIESSFYDTLTESKLAECKSKILSASSAAKECGGVCNSPFENVNLTEYTGEIRDRVFCASEVLVTEIRHLKSFLALFLEFYRQRVSTLTEGKLEVLSGIARELLSGAFDKYFAGADGEKFYLFFNANKRFDACLEYYFKNFKVLVDADKEYPELKRCLERGEDWKLSKAAKTVVKRLERTALHPLSEEDVPKFLQTVCEIYAAEERITGNTSLAKNFCDRGGRIVLKRRNEYLAPLYALHEKCAQAFMDYNPDSFNGMCIRAASGYTAPVLEGFLKAMDGFKSALESFLLVTNADRTRAHGEDVLDYYSAKAGALIDNADMLANWCMYKKTAKELSSLGLNFIAESLESGKLKIENVLAGFEKNVYKNFLEINVPADPDLCRMTAGTMDETVEKFRIAWEEFARLEKEEVRRALIARLPGEEEGSLSLELAAFRRLSKSNLRGVGIRGLFREIPSLARVLCPCMLMSPVTVAQYLKPEADIFDLVIFDEASQMSTAEAIGSIARAKKTIVVGDPKQLPPTAFFHTAYVDEENLENEDLESVLDDCLALGMPERHLLWHYRSKHESLIAFSNGMYYDNRLCTFPSPDSLESKVRLVQVDGTYDRGFTKRNRKETEALVKEVVRRLSDPVLSRSSIGIVTFSSAQQEDIERFLGKEIAARKLDGAAYDREEPLFVKNLENVQGDERDVILFSVCYGPDKTGRVSLNFGPLNQAGGWRRLNVAVSRAREEMVVFSTMTGSMIDLQKTSSKGVAGLKAFLEFAERGRTNLAVNSASLKGGAGIGKFIAAELKSYGYDCRCDVGASDFKIDVAVVDPKNKHRFLLAVVCDGTDMFSVKDRNVLQVLSLKRGNWNVMRVNSVNYYSNPKREIKRIKEMLDRLTGAEKKAGAWIQKYKKPYRAVTSEGAENAAFITGGEHDGEIVARLKEIVSCEEPISRSFLKKRCLMSFGIVKSGSKVDGRLDALIDGCAFLRERVLGQDYYYKNLRAVQIGKFRTESGTPLRREDDFTPFELVSFVKAALEERVALYMDELAALAAGVFGIRSTEKFASVLRDCVTYGEDKGLFVRSVSDRISLA